MSITKRKRRGASILAALVAVFALFFGLASPASQAASDSPYMMSTDEYVYVIGYTVPSVGTEVTTTDDGYVPAFFDSRADAEGIQYSTRADDGITVGAVSVEGEDEGSNEWVDEVEIFVSGTYGAMSVGLCNPIPAACPNGGLTLTNSANITVVRLASSTITDVASIDVRIYDPADDTGVLYYEADGVTILSNTFYETWNTNYPSALDSTYQMWYNGTIPELGYVYSRFIPGFGDVVDSMTVADKAWPYAGDQGWLYGVYRFDGRNWVRADVAKFVGADVYRLQEGDLVVWKYGNEADYDSLFQLTLPDPPSRPV
ncbi:MAG: hypothetical protein LBK54_11055 [Propionibacteriaceae bacterium]|jgi:hypothetical protein|nr:hypothetical protein [Propionibacteriaceae bacterium]